MRLIEFYAANTDRIITSVENGPVPRKGETVNILKNDYTVHEVKWCVDHSELGLPMRQLRACVELMPKAVT